MEVLIVCLAAMYLRILFLPEFGGLLTTIRIHLGLLSSISSL